MPNNSPLGPNNVASGTPEDSLLLGFLHVRKEGDTDETNPVDLVDLEGTAD